MQIVLEARALSAAGSGVRTYVAELIRHILFNKEKTGFTLLYDGEKCRGLFPAAAEVVIPLRHPLLLKRWLERNVTKEIRRLHPDVVHFTKAAVPARTLAPTVVTIYDLIPLLLPQTQTLWRRRYWRRALTHAARFSDHIVTISNASREHILRYFEVEPNKITVTPPAVNRDHFRRITDARRLTAMRQKYDIVGPYILFVGTRDLRKNVSALIRAFGQIAGQFPHNLVIVGGQAHKRDTSQRLVRQLHLETRVRMVGFVPYEDLPSLFSAADLFVWPSIIEGWGFPPQEAMACGTPVIVSNAEPLPEVVGAAARIVPFSTQDLAQRMNDQDFISRLSQEITAVLAEPALQMHLREAGLAQVNKFSWQAVADNTLAVYRQLL